MEPKKEKMEFREADRRYAELNRQRDAGTLTDEEFDARLKDLMVQDEEGRWWSKSRTTGEWYRRTASGDWVKDDPPGYDGRDLQSPPPSPEGDADHRQPPSPGPPRRRLVVAGILAALALAGLVVLVMVIRSGPTVPDVVGQTPSEAERTVGNDYDIHVSSVRVDDQTKGTIISQDPEAGKPAEQVSTISVVVSAGQPPDPGDILRDDFSDTSSGWDAGNGDGNDPWVTDYTFGFYRMYSPPSDTALRSVTTGAGTVEDTIVEVDATLESDNPGADASWGPICRAQDYSNYYTFSIFPDGTSGIWKVVDGDYTDLDLGPVSEAVRGGKEKNHLRADCVGNKLTFYVNDQKVAEAEDSTFASGQVGLELSKPSGKPLEVLFDNYVVSSP